MRRSLMSSIGGGEIAPEVAQHVLVGELAVGDLVELFLEGGGEVVFDIVLEEAFEEGRQQSALGLRDQPALVDGDIVAVFERLQDRRVGGGAADAELFHLLDQRRLGIARRRLGRVLGDVDLLALRASRRRRISRQAAVLLVLGRVVFLLVGVGGDEAVEADDRADGAQGCMRGRR